MSSKNKKILVTGVAGFLGSHLAEKLNDLGHDVIGIDNMLGGYEDNVPKKIEFHKKISEFENFDSLKILEIISFFSNAKKEINPNKINDKTKFIDLYNFYNK